MLNWEVCWTEGFSGWNWGCFWCGTEGVKLRGFCCRTDRCVEVRSFWSWTEGFLIWNWCVELRGYGTEGDPYPRGLFNAKFNFRNVSKFFYLCPPKNLLAQDEASLIIAGSIHETQNVGRSEGASAVLVPIGSDWNLNFHNLLFTERRNEIFFFHFWWKSRRLCLFLNLIQIIWIFYS